VLKEVSDSNGKIVLFIDEIHTVVGAGATGGAMDAGEHDCKHQGAAVNMLRLMACMYCLSATQEA
jgi:hypothetical protein